MSDLASTETVGSTAAESAPAGVEAESTADTSATSSDSGSSADDIRSAQVAALQAARGETAELKPETKGTVKDPATGKFVSPNSEAQKPATDPKSPTEVQPSAIPAPDHLPSEMKAVWDKMPPDAQQAVVARELELRKTAATIGNRERAFKPFAEVADQHRDYFETHKAHPAQVFNNLMAWNGAVSSDPVHQGPKLMATFAGELSASEKQVLVSNMARELGVNFSPSQSQADDFSLPPDPALQARFDAIERQNAQLVARLGQYEGSVRQLTQAQQQELEARAEQARAIEDSKLSSAVESFKSTVDAQEYEFLQPYIAAELMKLDPSMPDDKAMKTAYDAARKKLDVFVQPKISAVDKSRQEQVAKAAAAAKRAGSVNVEGAPQSSPVSMSIRDEQKAALARARGASAH